MNKAARKPSPYHRPPPEPRSRPWLVIAICIAIFLFSLFYFYVGSAATQYYLEDERDLGNGLKLCIYSEGYTLTRRSHELCPLTIRSNDE